MTDMVARMLMMFAAFLCFTLAPIVVIANSLIISPANPSEGQAITIAALIDDGDFAAGSAASLTHSIDGNTIHVNFLRDGGSFEPNAPFSVSWVIGALPAGAYIVQYVATTPSNPPFIETMTTTFQVAATAANLVTHPHNPTPGVPFIVEFDYTSNFTCPMLPTPVVFVLGPKIFVLIGTQCTPTALPQTSHVTASVPALPAGTYAVYGSIVLQSEFDPPPEMDLLEGSVSIGAASVIPTLQPGSIGALGLLIALAGVVLYRRRFS